MAKDMTKTEYIAIGLMLSGVVPCIDKELFSDAGAQAIAEAIASGDRAMVVRAMRHLLTLSADEPVSLQIMRAVATNGRPHRINALLFRVGTAMKIGDAATARDTMQLLSAMIEEMGVKRG